MRNSEPDPTLITGGGSDTFFGAGSPTRRNPWPAWSIILDNGRHDDAQAELLPFKP